MACILTAKISQTQQVPKLVKASDSRPKGLGSMPSNTLRFDTEHVSLNQWDRKSCGLTEQKPRVQGAGEYFPPPPVHA
ncbi:hypothetical protein TNCV_2377001 [Trichonephila clavipes]|nr:hypothetical protein TNCV_2377001 [Trichonephila clavipes]